MQMKQFRSFIVKNGDKYYVNAKETTSVLGNALQLDYLVHFKDYFRGKLLDAGCGEKPFGLIYDDLVESSIGIDVETCKHDQSMVDVFASVDDMPFEDSTFDTVLCTNVIEHAPTVEKTMHELTRVISEGGHLILSVPFLYPIHEAPYDYYRFTKFGLMRQLEENHMAVEVFLPWGGIGMLCMAYTNMFLCKLIKIRVINRFFAFLQTPVYRLYKLFCFDSLLRKGVSRGISSTVTQGYFIIAQKQKREN